MFYISVKKGNLYGITDTSDSVTEFYSAEQISQLVKKIRIYGVSPQGITVVQNIGVTFEDLCERFIRHIRRSGVDTGFERDIHIFSDWTPSTLSIRFITGMGNWYCREDENCPDICDADSLKREGHILLGSAIKSFYKEYGVLADYQTGEKANCYFSFY